MSNIKNILPYIQMGLSVLLIASILLQQRGAGLSGTFGGGGMEYSTKRGAEKVLFYATVVIAALFIATSILTIRLS